MVDVQLLGPVELSVRGDAVEVGPPQRRTVLAALAVDVGRPVAVDVVIERVWGADPPDGARRAVHAHVTRIRRVCERVADAGEESLRLVRRSGGYLLEARQEQVDVYRFRQLVDRAHATGQTDRARASLLRNALGLWHGEPLAGLNGQWAARTREAWRRQRVDAAVGWTRAESRLGDPGAVTGPLTELLGEHPLVEPLAEALMRALHDAGRSAEALDCYATVRQRLAEELGTDPGPALREMYQAILQGRPSKPAQRPAPPALVTAVPDAPALARRPSAASRTAEVPAQLPLGVRGFTGRDEELARLSAVLASAGAETAAVVISAVSGMAGVGKTALAVHWARRVGSAFPNGQLYVNLRGFGPQGAAVTPTEAVRGFLDAFGVRPERVPPGLDAQVGLYRSLLAGRRVLVVLDNARDERQVRPLLPGAAGCMALVTSRNRLTGLAAAEGAHLLPVDLLHPAAAREMLANRLSAGRVAAEAEAVGDIVARCAGLPLALAVVAARAAAQPQIPLGVLAEELREAGRRLDALDGGEPASQVRAVFSWSYRALSTDAARGFRLLGLHPGPDAGLAAVAALAGVPPEQAAELLIELTRGNLLVEHVPGRYAFHDLLRVYAGELVAVHDSEQLRRAAVHRMLDHYLHTAWAADVLVTPQPNPVTLAPARPGANPGEPTDYQQALDWFVAEYRVLLEVVRGAPTGFDGHVWRLAAVLTTFLDRHGYWQALAAVGRRALEAARRKDDRAGEANAHRGLGLALDRLEDPGQARGHYLQALELFAALGSDAGQARTHQHLARMSGAQGRQQQALEHAYRSLEHYRAVGDRAGQSAALNHIGWVSAQLGDHVEALARCEQALALALATRDVNGQAHTWDSLGYIRYRMGQYQQAVDCYRQAVELFLATGERNSEARCLVWLGDSHHSAHQVGAAHDAWTRALTITDELGLPDADPLRTGIRHRLTPSNWGKQAVMFS
ncbi:tetratricopeptide repeat protein [Streptomyces lunaelactis]|uniref:AfsR/SARP family transcriptional regulator n=1 Tax=Streptomyces lunaelactis TaxID=1535768 RepID=UPI001585A837|nr:BTAD domain-containing putative transcriptional regulator [Streptomyces lunaelactis]NUK37482.1 tetratricopeptide repeat protein [Streptomyces lunaelactis]NUK40987.1 tetratricopeptide repeat protein [Streptomyces lunaelactis]NUK71051.1 tetratricopeptide repeat protein [Streptomyces lunaelactis]NUK82424.1 tetratricopeptide repeat protein [Streptomyces lunaelactis]NUK95739.1 tetratricopeptide repeat protein [Streptomyces lunaelactis]